jgi:hypothetical protein
MGPSRLNRLPRGALVGSFERGSAPHLQRPSRVESGRKKHPDAPIPPARRHSFGVNRFAP